jgi:hypothetical protein
VIVRVLHDGQYVIDDATYAELSAIDERLDKAISAKDEAAFATAVAEAIEVVRMKGTAVPAEEIVASDLTLPASGSSIEDMTALLESEPEKN